MKKGFVGFLMLLSSIVAFNSYGQKPAVVTNNDAGWKKIGETTASFKMQNESIVVLGADEFTAIRLKVKDAPLDIERLQVFYESGDMEEIDVTGELNEDGQSQVFNLKHPDRDIKKVAFTYKTEANAPGDKAEVELYGLKTNQPMGKDSYRDDRKEAERKLDEKAEKTESDVERTSEKVGDKISEGVNDAAAAIKDQKVKGKVGPGGETAYIDNQGNYYYINNEGKKVSITKLQLKDKSDH